VPPEIPVPRGVADVVERFAVTTMTTSPLDGDEVGCEAVNVSDRTLNLLASLFDEVGTRLTLDYDGCSEPLLPGRVCRVSTVGPVSGAYCRVTVDAGSTAIRANLRVHTLADASGNPGYTVISEAR
jgi:hypothetical protein